MDSIETVDAQAEIEKGGKNNFAVRLKTQFTEGFVDRLIAAVDLDNYDADEYAVLGGILVRAGFAWRCVNSSCRGINHLDCAKCDNCGSRKAKAREVPVPEKMSCLSIEYDRELKRKRVRRNKSKAETDDNVLQSTGE